MAPTKQPTFPQIMSFLDLIKSQNLSPEQFQKSLENGDLFKQMLNCPDLSKISKDAFAEILVPKPELTLPWTPAKELVDRIMKRSQKRHWGFTTADADKLARTMHDHFGDLYPTSIKLWLGKTLKFNWSELILWIKDEVEALGYEFNKYLEVSLLAFFPGSEMSGKKSLDVVDLDLQTFWNHKDGIIAIDERPKCKKWPGLEVATLLALNPQIHIMMDGETVPYMLSAGLVVDSGRFLSHFDCHGRRIYVSTGSVTYRWYYTTMVAFREC